MSPLSFFPARLFATFGILLAAGAGSAFGDERPETRKAEAGDGAKPAWRALFDGKTMDGWEPIAYAGQGTVTLKDGAFHIGQGETLSGVRYTREDLPSENYEIELEARRLKGHDFFCCLTFPFRDAHASFVVGGWGGAVVGISNINFMDASENMTTQIREFETGKWYKIRLRATKNRIQAWLDDSDDVVNVGVKDKKVSMRFGEIEESVPLGISTFAVEGEARNVRLRALSPAEVAAAEKLDAEEDDGG